MNPYSDHLFVRGLSQGSVRVAERAWDEGYAAGLHEENAYPQAWRYGAAEENARIVAALRGKGTHAADVLADQIESEAPAGRAAATPDPPRWTAKLDQVRAFARECGYAIAVHGSEARDLDLIAAPWTPEAVSADQLIVRLCEECYLMEHPSPSPNPEAKPWGRLAWALAGFPGVEYVDLSVAPRAGEPVPLHLGSRPLTDAEAQSGIVAASPDERLREALTDCAATLMTVAPILEAHVYEPNASGYVWNAWTRWGERAASRIDAALTAADREAPDGER